MKIVTLVENTSESKNLKPEHGLSFYIETKEHKILFDLGPDETFMNNAQKLNIDISEVDVVVISHGHGDHGGGLATFLNHNNKARIYIHKNAFEPHYLKVLFLKIYVGLDTNLQINERIIFVDDFLKIDDELLVFSNVEGSFKGKGNRALIKECGNPDDFIHEQNLIITHPSGITLFTGCSHRGVVNIYRAAHRYVECINTVIGCFHLSNPASLGTESRTLIQQLASQLVEMNTTFYTCHCTGTKVFNQMQNKLQDKLRYLSTGNELYLYEEENKIENYLQESKLIDYNAPNIQRLVNDLELCQMSAYDKISVAYKFIRDDIAFGYNFDDMIPASKILADGFGQCNTKGILFMALLRAVDVPCRLHGFTINKALQKGAMEGIVYKFSPEEIIHSWVEVNYNDKWYNLEGFILDIKYLHSLQNMFSDCTGSFCGYGVATDNFLNPPINWNQNDTYIQDKGIVRDLGIFNSPDEFFRENNQHLSWFKKFLFRHYGRHRMNKNVTKIRNLYRD